MPKNARVFSLFLAGAGDVVDEQGVVRQLVEEWNVQHGLSQEGLITVTSWKTSTYPDAGGEAQEIINRQVVDDADIVVGVFWTRFGTPTAAADSGTQEEIERSIAASKKVMVYFSDRAVAPSTLDSKQYAKVQSFKKKYADRGLYSSYKDLDAFRSNFRTHLSRLMNDLLRPSADERVVSLGENKDTVIEIAFPTRYWVLILAAVDQMVQVSMRAIDDLRQSGRNPETLSEPEQTALAGPILVRGAIVDVLVKRGAMKKEAADKMGYGTLVREVEKRDPSGKKKGKKR
jgi:uncharacterized protein (DUF1330 family)